MGRQTRILTLDIVDISVRTEINHSIEIDEVFFSKNEAQIRHR